MVGSIAILAIPALASESDQQVPAGSITGNNSFDTAMSIGYWKYKNIDTIILPEGQDAAYFTFTANAGERIYVRSSYRNEYEGMKIELFNQNRQKISSGENIINRSSLTPFIYANADATSANQTFYIKVSRGANSGTMYFSLSIEDRIKTGSGTYRFSGSATNNGNIKLDLNGVESSVIMMDLTKDTTIPKGAIVKSVSTSSIQSPNQGNVHHMIMSNQNNIWSTSIVSSATSGSYRISLQDNLLVASKWNFKYNAKATAKSTMSNVNASINYEYDLTAQFN
ncbi:hypothetical protein [Bacillus gaemokensis]